MLKLKRKVKFKQKFFKQFEFLDFKASRLGLTLILIRISEKEDVPVRSYRPGGPPVL